jgi:hypothetical protein
MLFAVLSLSLVLFSSSGMAGKDAAPGSVPTGFDRLSASAAGVTSLQPKVTVTGLVTLSVDGLGTNNSTGIIDVDKPAGATVRGAYMAAASTGFSSHVIANGDMTSNGTGVNWDDALANAISSNNYWADVTAIVKPIVDAAAAGIVPLTIGETSSQAIDGSLIAVIFDDPNQTTDNTIVLMFGAQDIAGDQFLVALAEPLDKTDPELVLDMCLAISYGFQPGGQVSHVDVNSQRLTSSAGGQDDGEDANGALFTVGGIGDTNGNPPPFDAPTTPNDPDDELYSIIPFTEQDDVLITVDTINPSNDDNILFAGFRLSVAGDVVTDCLIQPPSLTFGPIPVGGTEDKVFRITNTGDTDLIGAVSESCDHFEITAGGGAYTLSSGQFVDVTVRFAPTVAGIFSCTIETGDDACNDVEVRGVAEGDEICEPHTPDLRLVAVQTVSYASPLWTIQVKVENLGPGEARNVVATMNENLALLTIPDPVCSYGDIADGATEWGLDDYTIDLSAWPGGSFNVFFEVTYEDTCGNELRLQLDPEFDPNSLPTDIPDSKSASYELGQNFPNPFNPVTLINFELASNELVSLKVYDASGKLVRTLVNEVRNAGVHNEEWDGRDNTGALVSSGVYFYRMTAGTFKQTKRMVLLK